MKAYEYRHTVTFEETNLDGNVDYTNPLRWQGQCWERFLRDHAPGVLSELSHGLTLVTTRCGCEYFDQVGAYDEVAVRMTLGGVQQNRMAIEFDYWRIDGEGEQLVARGSHEFAAMRVDGDALTPVPVPAELRESLSVFYARG